MNEIKKEAESIEIPQLSELNPKELANALASILDSKKGKDLKVINVEDNTVIADYFVICSGTSSTHVKALAEELEAKSGEHGLSPVSVEGRDGRSWILLDYSNVIVHIFSRDAREFYNLDKLYAETRILEEKTEQTENINTEG